MFQKLLVTTALAATVVFSSGEVYSQFGGLQVQVGGYGRGVRIGNSGFGNGFYGGYGNGFGNGFGNGYGNSFYGNYGNGYGNYSNGYYNNGFGYNNYPNNGYGYAAPRVYSAPLRSYPIRRYRYR